jgi:hypothetical protein
MYNGSSTVLDPGLPSEYIYNLPTMIKRIPRRPLILGLVVLSLVATLSSQRATFHHGSWSASIAQTQFGAVCNPAMKCPRDHCLLDDYVAWDDWKACKSQELVVTSMDRAPHMVPDESPINQGATDRPSANATLFDAFIMQHRNQLPWSQGSTFAAILLEFRAQENRLLFSIRNVMNNLPVQWRVQVVGGSAICNATLRLFPAEVAAGKIVATDIGERFVSHVRQVEDHDHS